MLTRTLRGPCSLNHLETLKKGGTFMSVPIGTTPRSPSLWMDSCDDRGYISKQRTEFTDFITVRTPSRPTDSPKEFEIFKAISWCKQPCGRASRCYLDLWHVVKFDTGQRIIWTAIYKCAVHERHDIQSKRSKTPNEEQVHRYFNVCVGALTCEDDVSARSERGR